MLAARRGGGVAGRRGGGLIRSHPLILGHPTDACRDGRIDTLIDIVPASTGAQRAGSGRERSATAAHCATRGRLAREISPSIQPGAARADERVLVDADLHQASAACATAGRAGCAIIVSDATPSWAAASASPSAAMILARFSRSASACRAIARFIESGSRMSLSSTRVTSTPHSVVVTSRISRMLRSRVAVSASASSRWCWPITLRSVVCAIWSIAARRSRSR